MRFVMFSITTYTSYFHAARAQRGIPAPRPMCITVATITDKDARVRLVSAQVLQAHSVCLHRSIMMSSSGLARYEVDLLGNPP